MSTSDLGPEVKAPRRYHHGGLREALLLRAVDVIAQDGVEAVTLRGLARDIGVSHAAPARHFPTRNDLLAALAEEGVDRLIAAADREEAALAERGGAQRLAAIGRAYLRWAREHPAHYRAVRNPEVMRHARPSLRAKLAAFAARQRHAAAGAQAAGWQPDFPLEHVVFRFAALLVGAATLLTDPVYREVFSAEVNAGADGSLERFLLDAGLAREDGSVG